MRVYRLEIESEEPLLVTGPKVGNISGPEREILTGITLRGALLYRAFKEGRSSLIEELREPKLIFHPAYPASEAGISEPAHPFIYKCKLCEGDVAEDHLEKIRKNPLELVGTIYPHLCERGRHLFSMKSLGGKLVVKKDGTYVQFKGLEFVRMEAVGMSKRFRNSEVGMVYNYLCFAPGSRFQGLIVDLSEDRLQLLGYREDEEYELRLGRGGSRGLGHSILKLTCEEGFLRRLIDYIERKLKETSYIFLKAKAPIYGLKALDDGFHVRSYLEIPPLKLEGEWITGTERISGFSLQTGYPKAMIKAAKPGSLYLYRPPEDVEGEELVEILVRASLVGLEPFNHLGLNLLEVV